MKIPSWIQSVHIINNVNSSTGSTFRNMWSLCWIIHSGARMKLYWIKAGSHYHFYFKLVLFSVWRKVLNQMWQFKMKRIILQIQSWFFIRVDWIYNLLNQIRPILICVFTFPSVEDRDIEAELMSLIYKSQNKWSWTCFILSCTQNISKQELFLFCQLGLSVKNHVWNVIGCHLF